MSKTRFSIIGAVAAAVLLAGCSSGGGNPPDSSGDGGDDTITINVGLVPYAEMAPVYIAEEQGWWEEAGIELNITEASSGATIIQSIAAGQFDVGYANSVSAVQAIANGLPLRAFRDNDTATTHGVYVLDDGPVKTAKDLEGRSIAVSGLKGIADLTSQAPLEAKGVDWSTVDLVQIAPADQEQALASGQVDAVWFAEPTRTIAEKNLGLRQISKALEGPTEEMALAIWVTNAQFWNDRPDDLRRFNDVLGKAMQYAMDNPDAVAEILPTFTALTPELTEVVKPAWVPDRDLHGPLGATNDLMVKYGYIPSPIDLDTAIIDAG